MDSTPVIFAELYFPLVLSICCIAVLFRSVRDERHIVTKLKPFGPLIEYHVEISNALIVRISLFVGAFAFLSTYLFYDYSAFFPRNYELEIFFDERGISQSLSVFSSTELRNLSMPTDLRRYREQYFQQIDSEIEQTFANREFFTLKDGHVHSIGRSQVLAEKISGWQNYHIKVAEGELTTLSEVPNKPVRQFYTRFERLPSADDYIRLSLADLFVRHHIVVRTENKQVLVQNNMPDAFVFKVTLVGITKLTVFPWPHVSNTVYLANFENVGLVPVAYAIHR
jgi:hypothetical protein